MPAEKPANAVKTTKDADSKNKKIRKGNDKNDVSEGH